MVNSTLCHHASVKNTGRQNGQNRPIRGLLMNANDDARAKRPEQVRDAGKGDCAGGDCGFLLRTAAETSVMTSPIGKGSMNVIAALKSGFSYSSLYLFIC